MVLFHHRNVLEAYFEEQISKHFFDKHALLFLKKKYVLLTVLLKTYFYVSSNQKDLPKILAVFLKNYICSLDLFDISKIMKT